MSSLYEQSVPNLLIWLNNVDTILDKAVEWAKEKKLSDEQLLNLKLVDDMLPLAFQLKTIQRFAADVAKLLGGKAEIPEALPTTVAEAKKGIADAIAGLKTVDKSAEKPGMAKEEFVKKLPFGDFKVTYEQYIQQFALSNFFFHFTTFYNILRKEGVKLGKADFLAGVLKQ